MSHYTNIGGTSYQITGGVLTNSTKYSINKGRTLIGGTGYNIDFSTPLSVFAELFKSGNVLDLVGVGSSSSSLAHDPIGSMAATLFYVFSFCEGQFAITKYKKSSTSATSATRQVIYQSSSTKGNSCIYNNQIGYSDDGSSRMNAYSSTLLFITFPNYSEGECDAIFGAIRRIGGYGRNTSSNSQDGYVCSADANLLTAVHNNVVLHMPIGNRVIVYTGATDFGDKYIYYNNGTAWLSAAGNAANLRSGGGSIIELGY